MSKIKRDLILTLHHYNNPSHEGEPQCVGLTFI